MAVSRCTQKSADPADRFRTYDEVMLHLDGLGLFHMDMGLDRMAHALQRLGVRRFPCPVVQVVGTNGKGSTSTFLHSLAMAHGFRAGLYTSPHFLSPTERIRMSCRNLPEAAWPDLANRALAVEPGLTYFELLTIMATLAFQDAEPDLLIFEAGLGGRFDATSALPADLVCFTPIGLDHMDVLGPELASIAADKAEAMRAGMFAAVSAPQTPEVQEALRHKASELNLPLCFADKPYAVSNTLLGPEQHALARIAEDAPLGLTGPHQRINAATALEAWLLLCRHQGWRTDEHAIRRGLADAFLPGRLQRIPSRDGYPAFLLDGAHNPHGMTALLAAVRETGLCPPAVIFSCLADKQPENLVPLVREIAGGAPILVTTIADNPRAASGRDLARLLGSNARAVPDIQTALDAVRDIAPADVSSAPVPVCGSLYLLTEFFTLFPHALHQRGE